MKTYSQKPTNSHRTLFQLLLNWKFFHLHSGIRSVPKKSPKSSQRNLRHHTTNGGWLVQPAVSTEIQADTHTHTYKDTDSETNKQTYRATVAGECAQQLIVEEIPNFDVMIATTADQQLLRTGRFHCEASHRPTVSELPWLAAVRMWLLLIGWHVHQLRLHLPWPTKSQPLQLQTIFAPPSTEI